MLLGVSTAGNTFFTDLLDFSGCPMTFDLFM